MCKNLRECIEEQEPDDCGTCYKYTRKKVYSAALSFGRSHTIQLCDCIIECDGFYIAIEHKTGKLNSEKLEDAERQLENCETELKNICSSVKVLKILMYEQIDTRGKLRHDKFKSYKGKLSKKSIRLLCIKTNRVKEICENVVNA